MDFGLCMMSTRALEATETYSIEVFEKAFSTPVLELARDPHSEVPFCLTIALPRLAPQCHVYCIPRGPLPAEKGHRYEDLSIHGNFCLQGVGPYR